MMIMSRTTSWGENGWPSTARSFLVARRSRSICAASRLYSPKSSDMGAFSGGAIAISNTSMGLRDALDPHKRDVEADQAGRHDGQEHDVQEVHPRHGLLRAVLFGEEE